MIGRTVSHCRIASKLGTGGMGIVSRDPELELLHGEPEFDRLAPPVS